MIDLLTAAIVVTLRRADEMGDAITARGGIGQLSAAPGRPKLADWVTLAITAAAAPPAWSSTRSSSFTRREAVRAFDDPGTWTEPGVRHLAADGPGGLRRR